MSLIRFACVFCLFATGASAQEGLTAELLKVEAPDGVAAPLKKELQEVGTRVLNPDGKPFAEIWLRRSIPTSGKPTAPAGTIQFPIMKEGELLGVVRYVAEGHDFRDQTIPLGVYTIRYGLQPVNGDHLGVSPFRDYGLLIPAAKDGELAPLSRIRLETLSAETTGSSHPAILMLLRLPTESKAEPKIVRDEAKNTSGVVIGLPLAADKADPQILAVQLVISGMAM